MDYLVTLALGAVQGITEFLPISSSGHLVILQSLMGITEGELLLDILLHLGTAIAILIVFRSDIIKLCTDAVSRDTTVRKPAYIYLGYLLVATIPAGVVGVLFNDFFEDLFSAPRAAAGMLLVTAALLFISAARRNDGGPMTLLKAIIIGCAQAVAIVPGISRSGTTIAVALLIGVSRTEAGRFSFLLALPAIFGAALLEGRKIDSLTGSPLPLLLGFLVSVVIGIIALKLLLQFVRRGKLYYFGFYCVVVGILGVIFL